VGRGVNKYSVDEFTGRQVFIVPLVSDLTYLVSDFSYPVSDFSHLVSDFSHLVSDFSHLVSDFSYLVSDWDCGGFSQNHDGCSWQTREVNFPAISRF
jgi:hypothetical protein